jgi:hypothetical protein
MDWCLYVPTVLGLFITGASSDGAHHLKSWLLIVCKQITAFAVTNKQITTHIHVVNSKPEPETMIVTESTLSKDIWLCQWYFFYHHAMVVSTCIFPQNCDSFVII